MGIYNAIINLNDKNIFFNKLFKGNRLSILKQNNNNDNVPTIVLTDNSRYIQNIVPVIGSDAYEYLYSQQFYDSMNFTTTNFVVDRILDKYDNRYIIIISLENMFKKLEALYKFTIQSNDILNMELMRVSIVDFIDNTRIVSPIKVTVVIRLLKECDRLSKFTLTTGRTENEIKIWTIKAKQELEKLFNLLKTEYEQLS